jgi:hypothetical protein
VIKKHEETKEEEKRREKRDLKEKIIISTESKISEIRERIQDSIKDIQIEVDLEEDEDNIYDREIQQINANKSKT